MVVVSNYGYEKKFTNDPFNRENRRRQKNTKTEAYNCGGFALGTFSWYTPYDIDIVDYAFNHGFIDEEERDNILSSVDEDEYYWAEQDFLENWNERNNNNGVPANATHNIPVYNCWAIFTTFERLEDYCSDVFNKNSGFVEYFVDVMLREIKGLRVINSLSDLKDNEYCIAFRVGHHDFHYVRSNDAKCEKWIGKMGSDTIQELPTPVRKFGSEEYFDVLFGGGRRYDSDTIIFAKVA